MLRGRTTFARCVPAGFFEAENVEGAANVKCVRAPPPPSSASRFTAGAARFFILSQSGERPER
jgi:hypothetical protein